MKIDILSEIRKNKKTLSVPQIYVDLLIVAEDHRYMQHNGVDIIAIIRAFYKTFFIGKVEGGSTISMQLARVITGRYEKSILRKIREIIYAYKITKYIPREEIPRIYLSMAYFGHGMTGIHAACKRKGVNMELCSEMQAAEIIARLKYPEPNKVCEVKKHKIQKRAAHILSRYRDTIPQTNAKEIGA